MVLRLPLVCHNLHDSDPCLTLGKLSLFHFFNPPYLTTSLSSFPPHASNVFQRNHKVVQKNEHN